MSCLEKNCHHADFKSVINYCEKKPIKLTPLRKAILEIICDATVPMTAYAILDKLKHNRPNAQVMSVYRVLNYLLEQKLIHRIESLNAVTLCHHLADKGHVSQWLICAKCGNATECSLALFQQGIEALSSQTGFAVSSPIIELSGVCADCQKAQV